MDPGKPASPAVEAFATFVRCSVAALERGDGAAGTAGEGLLFLGVWSDALPRLLVEDPVLAPTDKIVWQVIKLCARSGSATAFPSYQTIGRLANVRSHATIARAIAILRASRWLTLCAQVRDARGRYRGNVYALHDEPLDLADTLYLDPEHMAFLESASTHRHKRVREVASAALATIADDVGAGLDVTHVRHPLERRAEALETVYEQTQGGFYSFNRERLSALRRVAPTRGPVFAHDSARARPSSDSEVGASETLEEITMTLSTSGGRDATARTVNGGASGSVDGGREKAVDGDALGCSSRSRSRSRKTTTTTPTDERETREHAIPDLVVPEALGANHRTLALMYLTAVPAALRQPVLDELEGRLRAQRRGAPAIYDPLRFLHSLCEAARGGSFHPNLGIAVRTERERAHAAASSPPQLPPAPDLPPADESKPLVQRALRLQAELAERRRR